MQMARLTTAMSRRIRIRRVYTRIKGGAIVSSHSKENAPTQPSGATLPRYHLRRPRRLHIEAPFRIMSIVTLYMVVEHFKNGDPVPVYRRFREQGRLAPDALRYVSSWVDANLQRCYQLMEIDEPGLLDEWMARWSDIVDFEVYPVISSKEALEKVAPQL